MHTPRFHAFLLLLCLGTSALAAQTYVFDTSGQTGAGQSTGTLFSSLTPAQRFTTDASLTTLTGISLHMQNANNWVPNLQIFSDNGSGVPVSLVNSFASSTVSSGGWATFNDSVTLAANTTYWIVFGTTSGSANSYAWAGATNNGSSYGAWLTTADYNRAYNVGSGFSAYANQVMDLRLTAIPEPSTYAAILGAGALGCVVWRRRWNRRA
jgi:hypothetical protein